MKKIVFIIVVPLILMILGVFISKAEGPVKRILVEEFTSESCVNCPRLAGYIHASLEKAQYADNVIVICRHSGYMDDWLTTDSDKEYTWLYNAESTFAPALMVDRNANGANTPVYSIPSAAMMEQLWDDALAEDALISLDISGEYDTQSETIRVRLEGYRVPEFAATNPVMTVCLAENDVEAIRQSGAGRDYVHQHVSRAVNSTWGATVEFSGDAFEYECEIPVSFLWNPDNLYVVGYISNYNPEDPADCKVYNTVQLRLSDFSGLAAIETVGADMRSDNIYSIQGVRMKGDKLSPGIYVKNGRKVLVR